MNKNLFSIAIDGPSGSGKSSLAKNLAAKLGFTYLDTGALYRAIGLYICCKGIDCGDVEGVVSCLGNINIDISYENGVQEILLNGKNVSAKIRENHISKYAAGVSKIPRVREFLLQLQRDKAKNQSIIMDGRDIGTVILPDASLKIFLTASPEKRARRRYDELVQKSIETGNEISYNYEQILNEIIERDEQDINRAASPLKAAPDAIHVDNSVFNSLEETLSAVLKIVLERLPDVFIQ